MISLWIILFAGIGFGISYYISYKKKQGKPLACMVGMDCDAVVNSKYSTFFGIPNEVIGMLYYGFLILAFFIYRGGGLTDFFGISLPLLVFFASIGAMLFSVMLTYIQGIVLKQWCSWCLASAGINVLIVIFGFFAL